MGRIGVEPRRHHPARKRADFHLVSHHERAWPTGSGGKADDGRHGGGGSHRSPSGCWCSLPRPRELARHRLAARPIASCAGSKRVSCRQPRQAEWGKVKALQHLLTHSFSGKALAVRASDGEPWQTDPGRGRGHLGTRRRRRGGRTRLRAAGLSPQTAAARVHPEEQRQDAPPRHSRR